jgi:hypothetical protein
MRHWQAQHGALVTAHIGFEVVRHTLAQGNEIRQRGIRYLDELAKRAIPLV